MDYNAFTDPLKELEDCALCPRNCHADRIKGRAGYCKSGASFSIASVCIHKGEEPAISGSKGICNIFFTGCNMRCIYCQNHQISSPNPTVYRGVHGVSRVHGIHTAPAIPGGDLSHTISQITTILDQGINRVGFVSPSHFIPQMKVIINIIHSLGYKPIWVYNTNGYDKPETLRTLEGIIDVYLPDFKYIDPELAMNYSGTRDYPIQAAKALREMFRQKGTALIMDEDQTAESGMIVRHLVLPGQIANSIGVLQFLAEELSPRIHISLMAQYYPTKLVEKHPQLGRKVTQTEYRQVVEEMENLGMYQGWIQEFDSTDFYRPDFDQTHPFEKS